MNKKTVVIPDVSCNHCVMAIQNEVTEIDGVTAVDGDPKSKKFTFDWDSPATWEKILGVLTEIGYPPED